MGVDSIVGGSVGKLGGNRGKGVITPAAKFPLRVHKGTGYWCKKINGQVAYFGKVADDPEGVAALEEYRALLNGRAAGGQPGLTMNALSGKFLDHHEELMASGKRSARSFQCLKATCKAVTKVFGRERLVSDLRPDDFRLLRKRLAKGSKVKTRGAQMMKNEISRVRQLFKLAFDEGLVESPVRYGVGFSQPSAEEIAREREAHRLEHGDRMFEAHEIRRLLAVLGGEPDPMPPQGTEPIVRKANWPLRAMVLLGANCAFGNTDVASLPLQALDLDGGWVEFARTKNATPRRIPLWPETIEAIRDYLKVRPEPRKPSDAALVFLTVRGAKWVKVNEDGMSTDGVGQEFVKALNALGLRRPKLSFYGLRHGFETIAGKSLDQIAVDRIMGHKTPGMGTVYRERIADDRLGRVTETVRHWVFADTNKKRRAHSATRATLRPETQENVDETRAAPAECSDPPCDPLSDRVADGVAHGSQAENEKPTESWHRGAGSHGSQFSEASFFRWEASTAEFDVGGADE